MDPISGCPIKITASPASNTILSVSKVNVSPAGRFNSLTTLWINPSRASPLGRRDKSKLAELLAASPALGSYVLQTNIFVIAYCFDAGTVIASSCLMLIDCL